MNGLAAGQNSIRSFLRDLAPTFQREKSSGLDSTFHFTFTGQEEVKATVVIRNKTVEVAEGHLGSPNMPITADAETWFRFLRKEVA